MFFRSRFNLGKWWSHRRWAPLRKKMHPNVQVLKFPKYKLWKKLQIWHHPCKNISSSLLRCKNSGEVTGTFPEPSRQCNHTNPHWEALPNYWVTVLPWWFSFSSKINVFFWFCIETPLLLLHFYGLLLCLVLKRRTKLYCEYYFCKALWYLKAASSLLVSSVSF